MCAVWILPHSKTGIELHLCCGREQDAFRFIAKGHVLAQVQCIFFLPSPSLGVHWLVPSFCLGKKMHLWIFTHMSLCGHLFCFCGNSASVFCTNTGLFSMSLLPFFIPHRKYTIISIPLQPYQSLKEYIIAFIELTPMSEGATRLLTAMLLPQVWGLLRPGGLRYHKSPLKSAWDHQGYISPGLHVTGGMYSRSHECHTCALPLELSPGSDAICLFD